MSVVVLGSAVMDLVARTDRLPRLGESRVGDSFYQAPGGKGANQAVAARRMGAAVAFVGCVGNDPFGAILRESLAREDIDIRGLRSEAGAPSGCALISVIAGGENAIVVVPGANLSAGETELAALDAHLAQARVLMLQLEVPLAVVAAAAERASRRGVAVLLDPAPVPPRPLPRALLSCCTLLLPNAVEAEQLTGLPVRTLEQARAAADALAAAGARQCIVKLDARGGWFKLAEGEGSYEALPVRAVDTVAAGDAFAGALAAGIAEGLPVRKALDWARAAGALAVTRAGAQPALPTRQEVLALLRERGALPSSAAS